MIVTCERCATQFQLEDARVPEDGVRVRCSRCKHAFFIERPARNEAEQIHRIARRALEEAPGVTEDLEGPPPDIEPGLDEAGEDDWQFADDAPFLGVEEEPDPQNATAVLGLQPESGLEFGALSDFGLDAGPSGLDLEGDAGLDLAVPNAPDEDATRLLADLREELQEEVQGDEAGAEDPPEPVVEPGPLLPEPAPGPRREHVSQPARAGAVEAVGGWGLAEGFDRGSTGSRGSASTRVSMHGLPELEEAPSERAQWLARAGNAAGWACVLFLLAVGLHGGVSLQSSTRAPSSATVQAGGFELSGVETRFVENLYAGPMLVVTATARNLEGPAKAGLQMWLLDRDGQPVEGAARALAPAVAVALVRERAPDEVAAAQQALRSAGGAWKPGDERRLMAVVSELPDSAAWVHFEALEDARTPPTASAVVPSSASIP